MLTFKLNYEPTNIQQMICYVRKSPIFQSHKSYKNSLANIKKNHLKLKTRVITILIFTFFMSKNIYSQFAFNNIEFRLKEPPKSAYRIVQTEKGKLKKILEFNNRGKIIFDYRETEIPYFFDWNEPHRFIYAYEYDSKERVIKRYDFNSNAGLTIYTSVYDENPLTKTLFSQEYTNSEKVKKNSNAYSFISKFQNFKQLKESKEVANILSSLRSKERTETLNQDNKPIDKKEYYGVYGDTIITYYKYNSKGQLLSNKSKDIVSGDIKRKTTTEHNQNTEISEIINFRNGKKTTFHRFAKSKDPIKKSETSYFERNGIINIRHKILDKDGYLIRVSVFETKFKKDLIIPITKDLKKTAEMIYKYDKNGLLEKELMTNYKTNKKDIRKYKYKIQVLN